MFFTLLLTATIASDFASAAPTPQQVQLPSNTLNDPHSDASLAPLSSVERAQVVNDLANQLASNYVFPEIAQDYARTLRRHLAEGKYEHIEDPNAFAITLSNDLKTISPDLHLRVNLAKNIQNSEILSRAMDRKMHHDHWRRLRCSAKSPT